MSWVLDGRPLRRVLVTRLRYLGDVVMSSLVADLLKAGDPRLEVGFLCEAAHGPVLEGHPALDRLHLLASGRRGKDARARTRTDDGPEALGALGTLTALRRTRYDLAVDLFFNPRSAWMLRLSGIPARIGGTSGSRRHLYTRTVVRSAVDDSANVLGRRAPGVLGDHVCRLAPLRHAGEDRPFLDWLDTFGDGAALQPRLPRPALGPFGRAALAAAGVDGDYVVAAPAATWPSKEWPVEHWRQLLTDLPARLGRQVVVLVPQGRDPDWMPPDPVAGLAVLDPLPLSGVLELLGSATGLVSVDGGVMHAAVAMEVPTLALFGPTLTEAWFPYDRSGPFRVLASRPDCYPCHRLTCDEFICLPDLQPARVAQEFQELLEGARDRGNPGPLGRVRGGERDVSDHFSGGMS